MTAAPTPRVPSVGGRAGRAERGQATVEVALALPVVAVILLGVLQVAVVGHDHVRAATAARAGARAASIESPAAGRTAALALVGADRASVSVTARGADVTVRVTLAPRRLPFVGRALGAHRIAADATFRNESAAFGEKIEEI